MLQGHKRHDEKSIIFIGFMGAGKSTIGKSLARKLNWTFIDVDAEIEREYEMPVPQIFARFGERAFRDREKSLITSLCTQKRKVISLGGGAFLQEEIRNDCMEHCIVIFLDISFESWKQRIDFLIEDRPILQGKTMEEIEELFHKRQVIYRSHHLKISTDNKGIEELSDEIVEKLTVKSLSKEWDKQ